FVAADVEVEVLVFFLVFLEERVLVVLADVLDLLDVFDIGDFLFGAGFLGIGIFEGDHFGLIAGGGGRGFLDLDFLFLFLLFLAVCALARRGLLEERARIGFAGVGRNDGVAVEVVELAAGLGVFALGSAGVFGQGSILH